MFDFAIFTAYCVQKRYEELKESLEKNLEIIGTSVSKDHAAIVEVKHDE